MELRQLQYFVTIVELMSFSKAAKELHISQPSLSNAMKNLENEIGFQLLERNTRNMRLTEGGEILYRRALHLLSESDAIKKEMAEVGLNGSGELFLGMIESAKHWIPKIIAQYNQQYPNMHLHLTEVLSEEDVKKSLKSYETHAIITNQLVKDEEIEIIPLYREEFVLLLHESHPLHTQALIKLEDLETEPLIITSEGFQTRKDILKAFESEKITPTIKYEIERFETALSFVSENLGIALIPKNYLKSLQNYPIDSKTIDSFMLERTVYLTYMKNRYMSPANQAFIHNVKDFFL